jgi:hypothetical protein
MSLVDHFIDQLCLMELHKVLFPKQIKIVARNLQRDSLADSLAGGKMLRSWRYFYWRFRLETMN